MANDLNMLDKRNATVADAVNLLKRTFLKSAMSTRNRTTIIVPREALPKIAKAIDETGRLYPEPLGDFIHFNGISIVAEEGGEAALKEATTWIRTRQGIA